MGTTVSVIVVPPVPILPQPGQIYVNDLNPHPHSPQEGKLRLAAVKNYKSKMALVEGQTLMEFGDYLVLTEELSV